MALPSTVKAVYINSVQLYGASTITRAVGATSDAVIVRLVDADWGKVPKDIFEDERPLGDGRRRRGHVYGVRSLSMRIEIQVNPSVVTTRAHWERYRDQAWRELSDLLIGDGQPIELRVDGQDAAGASTSRVLYVELEDVRGAGLGTYKYGHGLVGHYSQGFACYEADFRALFPWWLDRTETTIVSAQTLDGTLRTRVVSNGGNFPCPVKIKVAGSGTVDIAVLDATSGADVKVSGNGVLFDDLPMVNTSSEIYVVDQFVDDPQTWRAYESVSGSSIRGYLAPAPRLWLAKGSRTLSWQVTSGTLTSGTITITKREWRADP